MCGGINIMDHLIDQFDIYIEIAFQNFYKEINSNMFKTYKECPSYQELKMLLDSVNAIKSYAGMPKLSIKQMLIDQEHHSLYFE